MSDLTQLIAITLLPTVAGAAMFFCIGRQSSRAHMLRSIGPVWALIQVGMLVLMLQGMHAQHFIEPINARVVGGTDRISINGGTTRLRVDGADGYRELYIAERLPAACERGTQISKPACSLQWRCVGEDVDLEYDSLDAKGWLLISSLGSAYLLLMMWLSRPTTYIRAPEGTASDWSQSLR